MSSQDIVHAYRPGQVPRREGLKPVTPTALVQAGVDVAYRYGAPTRLVKKEAPAPQDLLTALAVWDTLCSSQTPNPTHWS